VAGNVSGPSGPQAAGDGGIDPEDTSVVPAALAGMVAATRSTYRVMNDNGCYTAITAVGAVEDTVATLAEISAHLQPYVGDYSRRAGTAIDRVRHLLAQARTA
jgi:hypothetical protein